MFSAEILERIYSDEQIQDVPVCYQSTVVRVVERVLKEADDVPVSELSNISYISSTKDSISNYDAW